MLAREREEGGCQREGVCLCATERERETYCDGGLRSWRAWRDSQFSTCPLRSDGREREVRIRPRPRNLSAEVTLRSQGKGREGERTASPEFVVLPVEAPLAPLVEECVKQDHGDVSPRAEQKSNSAKTTHEILDGGRVELKQLETKLVD